MSRAVERLVLGVVVLVLAGETYLAYSAYSTVQAQTAKITALETKVERELASVRADAEARAKRVEDEFARIRRP
jgi:hypothetical protein